MQSCITLYSQDAGLSSTDVRIKPSVDEKRKQRFVSKLGLSKEVVTCKFIFP